MPNCFRLYRKGQQEASTLVSIDEAICAHLGAPVHPTKYVCGWYDFIGFKLACGKNWSEIKTSFRESIKEWPDSAELYNCLIQITEFLEENYTPDAWVEIGKR